MNVSLTPELEQFVADRVKTGMYHSSSEVIREALRLLKEQDALKEVRLAELRRDIQRGKESGPAKDLDIEDVIHRGKQCLGSASRPELGK